MTKCEIVREINEIERRFCDLFGVPFCPFVGEGYWFSNKATLGYSKVGLERYRDAYGRKLSEAVVEPATDKRWKYIRGLANENEMAIIEGARLNRVSASYVIQVLKAAEADVRSPRHVDPEVFKAYEAELKKVVELNGKEAA